MTRYKRAPITEAVIEIRFEKPLPKKSIEKLNERLKDSYASSDPVSGIGVKVYVKERQATFDETHNGYKLASKDQTDVLMIIPTSMICSRSAPYTGWESFRARAEENWKQWKQITGYKKIERLGVRYINRIDIPVGSDERIRVEDYLNVYPQYPEPEPISGLSTYTMQIVGYIGKKNFNLIINSNVVPSPLVNHVSILLDIDIAPKGSVPQKDDEIWAMFEIMREHKNDVFESSVTDNARRLFDK